MPTRLPTWGVPAALVALGVVPVVAGSLRLAELSGGAAVLPLDGRYTATPVPVVVHIVCATVFALLGALQFAPGVRARRPAWHRRTGRVLVVAGLGVALSALWLNQFFPNPDADRQVLYPLRVVFGVAMVAGLVLGLLAARRRDFGRHRVWMVRSYAIGLVAGTQVLTLGFGGAVLGRAPVTTALLMASAWVVNLVVAEWALGRPASRTGPRPAGALA